MINIIDMSPLTYLCLTKSVDHLREERVYLALDADDQ